MSLSVSILQRNFSPQLSAPLLLYLPERYSWAAVGGPKQATIRCAGVETALWETIEWLRCPIEIANEAGTPTWWGCVHEVQLRIGRVNVGVSLDSMINNRAVAYANATPGASGQDTRATTAWSSDTDSVATYGTKEQLASLSSGSAEQATAHRNSLLSQTKYPIPVVSYQAGSELTATLICRGWYATLDWKYFSNLAGIEKYDDTSGAVTDTVGTGIGDTKQAQSFGLAAAGAWDAANVSLRVKRTGTVADNLKVEICADSAGLPGSVLASGTYTGSSIGTDFNWITINLAARTTISYGTTYWIVVSRTGADTPANYYTTQMNTALGYTRGVFKLWNGSAWVNRSPNADLLFKVGGVQETTAQIQNIVTTAGQFLAGTQIDTASGIYSSQYRDGESTARVEVDALLKSGTTNNRRLLATVTRDRMLRVYEEPVSGSNDYLLVSDGSLRTAWDTPIDPASCPAGVWARLKDVIPATVDVSKLADPSRVFIEESEYDVRSGDLKIVPRNTSSPFDLATLKAG